MSRVAIVLVAVLALGMVYPGVAVAETAHDADLQIDQPDYIDTDVNVDQTNDTVIYQVRGEAYDITLQNEDHADVTRAGVTDGGGELSYNPNADVYRFDPEGQEGSSTLFWVVEEEVEVEQGNETVTETETTRYEAVIQTGDVAWAHRPADEDDELQAAASNWNSVVSEANQLAPDREAEEVISDAFTYFRFFDAPFQAFIDDMRATLVMMFLRPGGWVITGVFVGVSLIGLAYGARYRNRTQKQFEDINDLWEEKQEAFLKKARRICLQFNDYNQFLPDDVARAMREYFGRNIWIGMKSYMMMRSPTHIKGVVLQMMGQIGYHGTVERGPDGTIVDGHVVHKDDSEGDGSPIADGGDRERIDLTALAPEDDQDMAFVRQIRASELDMDVFNHHAVDLSKTSFNIAHVEVDDEDLLDELDPDIPGDVEDKEQLARVLAELIQFTLEHDHTDDLGRSRRGMDIVSFMAEMDAVLADDADFPIGQIQRRLLLKAADEIDPEDELEETVERVNNEGAGS